MDIAITGSHGLIGSALATSLEADGHRVVRLVRGGADGADAVAWDPTAGTIDAERLEGLDGVVHLAGEGIASRPWSDAQRRRIRESREAGTTLLATSLAGLARPPAVLVSGSAIGIYGDRGDEVLTEASAPGDDFLADVCLRWEAATASAEAAGIRTVHVRTGIVLDPHGGALGKQLPAFKLGLGAKAGRGTQWFSWISLHDEVAAIRHLLDAPSVSGPVNLTAPNPVTNAEFTDALGEALHRPTFLTLPRALRHLPLGVGPLVESLLFTSDRVLPRALESSGFTFAHPDLAAALPEVLGRS
ncbi:MAG: TIGR01777 family oxidoreductase [Acidimicrobiales bacterium]|nr:TIGR01777 family oxidoreductase [Actinomycetota bacterium]